tara:strand:- start:122 stop:517 length:396 start_codon:yes stop_codon:yes gene_type:complete
MFEDLLLKSRKKSVIQVIDLNNRVRLEKKRPHLFIKEGETFESDKFNRVGYYSINLKKYYFVERPNCVSPRLSTLSFNADNPNGLFLFPIDFKMEKKLMVEILEDLQISEAQLKLDLKVKNVKGLKYHVKN